jgi:HSP20 family protein
LIPIAAGPSADLRSCDENSTERKQEKEDKGKKFRKVERSYGKFVRQFTLPTGIDTTKVQAEFKDGMLNVHLPKTAAATPKSVDVKVA